MNGLRPADDGDGDVADQNRKKLLVRSSVPSLAITLFQELRRVLQQSLSLLASSAKLFHLPETALWY